MFYSNIKREIVEDKKKIQKQLLKKCIIFYIRENILSLQMIKMLQFFKIFIMSFICFTYIMEAPLKLDPLKVLKYNGNMVTIR